MVKGTVSYEVCGWDFCVVFEELYFMQLTKMEMQNIVKDVVPNIHMNES